MPPSTKTSPRIKGLQAETAWIEEEAGQGHFGDLRLERRFKTLLGELSERLGSSLPFACQDRAATKAAYRFFANPRIAEADLLGGHFEATRSRA